MSVNYSIRKVTEKDHNLILHSWMLCNRFAHQAMENEEYFYEMEKDIKKLLDRCRDSVVFCDEMDRDHLFGYCIFETIEHEKGAGHIIHYIYTKSTYRGFGIAKSFVEHQFLMPDDTRAIYLTHRPKEGLSSLKALYGVIYNPYLLRY